MRQAKLGWAALCAACIAGCTFPNHREDLRIRELVPQTGRPFALAMEETTGARVEEGNSVTLVENGKIFDALEAELRQAQLSMNLSTFIWRPSAPSDRILRVVLERAAHGVRCRVLVDPFWSIGFSELDKVLSKGGCEVRQYRPLRGNFGPRLLLRDHRRSVIVDGRVGITGGFGIWKSWEGNGESKEHWRDSNVVVRGPVVHQMQIGFAESWQNAGGSLLPPDELPDLEPQGEIPAAFVLSTPNLAVSDTERMTLLMIAAARHRIWIANAYFIPSTAIGDMLIAKAKAGVDVRVVCPGPIHDVPPVRAAQRSTYERLLEGGVRIWEYQLSMMHAKTILVDDRLAVVGSANIDPLSTRWMEEASLVAEDPQLNAQMAESFERDLDHSLEIRWSWWHRRGLLERFFIELTPLIGLFL